MVSNFAETLKNQFETNIQRKHSTTHFDKHVINTSSKKSVRKAIFRSKCDQQFDVWSNFLSIDHEHLNARDSPAFLASPFHKSIKSFSDCVSSPQHLNQNTHDFMEDSSVWHASDSDDSSHSSSTLLDPLFANNFSKWGCSFDKNASLAPDVEYLEQGEKKSGVHFSIQCDMMYKWNSEDDAYHCALRKLGAEWLSMKEASKSDCIFCVERKKDNEETDLDEYFRKNEEKLKKRRRKQIRKQIAEAKWLWRRYGVWIEKEHLDDEDEMKMWKEAKTKLWELEKCKLKGFGEKLNRRKVTLEELKICLKDEEEKGTNAQKILYLKRMIEKKEKKEKKEQQEKQMSELEMYNRDTEIFERIIAEKEKKRTQRQKSIIQERDRMIKEEIFADEPHFDSFAEMVQLETPCLFDCSSSSTVPASSTSSFGTFPCVNSAYYASNNSSKSMLEFSSFDPLSNLQMSYPSSTFDECSFESNHQNSSELCSSFESTEWQMDAGNCTFCGSSLTMTTDSSNESANAQLKKHLPSNGTDIPTGFQSNDFECVSIFDDLQSANFNSSQRKKTDSTSSISNKNDSSDMFQQNSYLEDKIDVSSFNKSTNYSDEKISTNLSDKKEVEFDDGHSFLQSSSVANNVSQSQTNLSAQRKEEPKASSGVNISSALKPLVHNQINSSLIFRKPNSEISSQNRKGSACRQNPFAFPVEFLSSTMEGHSFHVKVVGSADDSPSNHPPFTPPSGPLLPYLPPTRSIHLELT
eukprot:MONOS_7535.1-p1 / transcript=MONOS_7535.1 / gene=MONOS_7535 / organism=Monocercomonoides_exilis_PA203 / gene_product=unspecified product / transcript_product=unspecified product / location=Mono_scaffold00259:70609-72855(-) / protein_length=749 / sequence_SO=supercontig / SO=protein_coding / is_pseudo=false